MTDIGPQLYHADQDQWTESLLPRTEASRFAYKLIAELCQLLPSHLQLQGPWQVSACPSGGSSIQQPQLQQRTYLDQLPPEIIGIIFSDIRLTLALTYRLVCKSWNANLVKHLPLVWRPSSSFNVANRLKRILQVFPKLYEVDLRFVMDPAAEFQLVQYLKSSRVKILWLARLVDSRVVSLFAEGNLAALHELCISHEWPVSALGLQALCAAPVAERLHELSIWLAPSVKQFPASITRLSSLQELDISSHGDALSHMACTHWSISSACSLKCRAYHWEWNGPLCYNHSLD